MKGLSAPGDKDEASFPAEFCGMVMQRSSERKDGVLQVICDCMVSTSSLPKLPLHRSSVSSIPGGRMEYFRISGNEKKEMVWQ